MIRATVLGLFVYAATLFAASLPAHTPYRSLYDAALRDLNAEQRKALALATAADLATEAGRDSVRRGIAAARVPFKRADFWLRYLEPVLQRRINGPLAVEWETEVFEKFERPYRREGAGLMLAEQYLDEDVVARDTLARMLQAGLDAVYAFSADSIVRVLETPDHFFFANRLFLLNLAALYTTGFECPDAARVVPELRELLRGARGIYDAFGASFPRAALSPKYIAAFDSMTAFVAAQPDDNAAFDHFTFIARHVNPLFAMNQEWIRAHGPTSRSVNDYSLDNDATSIFDKSLFAAQNTWGVYSLVEDPAVRERIRNVGKLLFYDPIVSGNNARSCASCHKPDQYFADTLVRTSLQFDRAQRLPRNTPTLINAVFNHLIMLDGKHLTLDEQAKAVVANPLELKGSEQELLAEVMSCGEYRKEFQSFRRLVPEERSVTADHIVSALTAYYGAFSATASPFDEAINGRGSIPPAAHRGFNLFMSKAQCGTCHFVPQFNGVKPPYIGSEFEVIGVPADSTNRGLSTDRGRYEVHAVPEMLHAFRTTTVRNVERTRPYMHNGAYSTLDQVIDFYDAGGGAGLGLDVPGQTLPADSLHLTPAEKADLKAFLHSLNEAVPLEAPPAKLPASSVRRLNGRKVGGEY